MSDSTSGTEDGRRSNKAPFGLIATPTHLASYAQGDSILFSGSATDREDGTLSGASMVWRSDRDGQIGTGTSFVRTDLSVGQHTITMISTDSRGASFKHNQSLTITARVNQPPVTAIAAPVAGISVPEGTSVQFAGTAADPESGPIADSAMVWTSSRDGEIGRGKSFSRTLSAGSHTVRLTARDSVGAIATTEQSLTVSPVVNQPPFGLISAPAHLASFVQGANVSFAGSASDPEDGALTGASLVWRSDRDGQIATGVSFTKNSLSVGQHLITLTSTDSDGASFSHNLIITVTAAAPAPASQLTISTQPSASVPSGVAFAVQPVVQLRDASNNLVSQAGVVVTVSKQSGSGTLAGTTTATTNASGVASFVGLSISGSGAHTLLFSGPGLNPAGSSTITVAAAPAPATALSLTTQPSSTVTTGLVLAVQPAIQLRNASGGVVNQSGVAVTASMASGVGVLSGPTTVTTNASGVASFSGLVIVGVGSSTIRFTASGLTPVTSNVINVVAVLATQLAMSAQPSASATSGAVFAQQPSVQLRNSLNGAVSQSGVAVTAVIASGGGTLGGTTTATTNSSGVATFANLSITGTDGARTLRFSASSLTSATSNSVNVTSPAPPPSGSEPMFDQASVTVLQDNMNLYSSVSAMLGTVSSSIAGFHPGEDPRNELGLTTGRGGVGTALRINFLGGTQTGSTWQTHGTPTRPNSATHVIQYYARVNFSSALNTTVGVKWLMGWHNSGNDRIQWHMHWRNPSSVCPQSHSGTPWTFWQAMDQSRYAECQGAQPVGPFIENVANGQWHRFTHEYKPQSAPGRRDGVVRMWIDGVKIMDVSAAMCGTGMTPVVPPGAENGMPWCTPAVLDHLAVNDGIAFLKFGGPQTTTTPPWTMDIDDLVWWTK